MTVDALKVPPQSIDAEQSLLGGLLLDNQRWDSIADRIGVDDFYRREHRLIFSAISALCQENSPADVITVSERLEQTGDLDAAGGLAYLGSLANNTPSAANVSAYADIVRERAILRQLLQATADISDTAYSPGDRSAGEVLDFAEKRIFDISEQRIRRRGGYEPIAALLTKTVDRIDELYRTQGSITGVATGFTDLDERTSGLQPSDLIIIAGRPSMGKCIVSGSRILNPISGELQTVDDIVARREGCLLTIDESYKFRITSPCDFVDDGIKPVFRVRTALGREVTTTLTHPFLTTWGWRSLGELQAGDRIAVPRSLPYFGKRTIPEAQTKLIAYFLSDGGLTGSSPAFTNSNSRLRDDFVQAVNHFPGVRTRTYTSGGTRSPTVRVTGDSDFIKRNRSVFAQSLKQRLSTISMSLTAFASKLGVGVSTVHYWTVGAAVPGNTTVEQIGRLLGVEPNMLVPVAFNSIRKSGRNPVREWLSELGLWGRGAHDKQIPPVVFELSKPCLSLFLNRLFACDGSIYIQNEDQVCVSYCSVNKSLARDVQHLLLRFGILAKLRWREVNYQGSKRPFFELRVTGQNDVRRFIEDIGVFGKEQIAERALDVSRLKRSKVNLDILPTEVWEEIEEARKRMPWKEIYRRLGKPESSNFHVGQRGISRRRLGEIAKALDNQRLKALAESDVYWDRIESVEYVGERQVYDLTVPETHNFVAEDIVVHNTTLAMNIAENAAVGHKIPVAIFSMEMPGTQLAMRMMASLGRINSHRIRTGKLDDEDWPRLTSAVSLLSEAPIFIDDTPALTPMELRARARRIKREHDLGLIIVDYLQLMQTGDAGVENRATEISNITRSLKGLAKELNVPLIAMSQLNRSLESRTDKRPVMSDLRESGAIEQDSDVILFIYRDEVYHEDSPNKGTAEIIIGKQRNGPIGKVTLTFLGEYTKFENYISGGFDREYA